MNFSHTTLGKDAIVSPGHSNQSHNHEGRPYFKFLVIGQRIVGMWNGMRRAQWPPIVLVEIK
jgi:hypothetical protein